MFANHRPLLAYLKALGGKRLPWDANSEPCFEEALLSLLLRAFYTFAYTTLIRDVICLDMEWEEKQASADLCFPARIRGMTSQIMIVYVGKP